MSTGYASTLSDIGYLFDVASASDRKRVAALVKATVKEESGRVKFFDLAGAEIELSEVHRRTQHNPEVQHTIYGLRMTYGLFGRNIDSTVDENA